MNGWSALDRFLRTDPRGAGCAQALDMLHVYVDLDRERGRREPGER